MKTKPQLNRARRLPTSVPVPVDEQFIEKFLIGGWPRVNRLFGKRAKVWERVIGKSKLKAMRREYLAGRTGV